MGKRQCFDGQDVENQKGGDTMTKKKKDVIVVNLRNFPKDLHERAVKQAGEEYRTLKGIICKALEQYLDRKEADAETHRTEGKREK